MYFTLVPHLEYLMNVMLSNDDGYYSEGIQTLYETLKGSHRLMILAPHTNQSGTSSSLTLRRPIRLHSPAVESYYIEGTPADCVLIGINELFKNRNPEFVISGINNGANLGDDVIYSGTVAGAAQACMLGLPSFAISLAGAMPRNFKTAASIAQKMLALFEYNSIPDNVFLNINIPDLSEEKILGYKITRLGSRQKGSGIIKDHDPYGNIIYWLGPSEPASDSTYGTDFWAIDNGYVSITPLSNDHTSFQHIDNLNKLFGELEI